MKYQLMQDLNILPNKVLYDEKIYDLRGRWENGLGVTYISVWGDYFFVIESEYDPLDSSACFFKEKFFEHLCTGFIKIL